MCFRFDNNYFDNAAKLNAKSLYIVLTSLWGVLKPSLLLLLFIVSAVVGTPPEGVFLRLGSTDDWYIYTGLQYLQGSLKV